MPALADEIARLSKENAQLRSQIARGGSEDTIHGLSFYELKAILENKGLLSFLDENRSELGSSSGIPEGRSSDLSELCVLGLLGPHPSWADRYELTDAGRVFLNRLEAQRRVSQDAD